MITNVEKIRKKFGRCVSAIQKCCDDDSEFNVTVSSNTEDVSRIVSDNIVGIGGRIDFCILDNEIECKANMIVDINEKEGDKINAVRESGNHNVNNENIVRFLLVCYIL